MAEESNGSGNNIPQGPSTEGPAAPPVPGVTLSSSDIQAIASHTARLVQAASIDLQRQQFAAEFGLSFEQADGTYNRKLSTALGYIKTLTPALYRARFERGGIASRIIKAPAAATWAGGFDIVEDPDPGVETPFELAVREMFKRIDAWAMLLRADILAGIGRYAVLFIGASEKNPSDPEQPLKRASEIAFLSPFAEDRAAIQKEVGLNPDGSIDVASTKDPRFGLPEVYSIKFGSGLTGAKNARATRSRKVHWSRVIHIAEGALEDEVCGEPRLRACWNLLDDLDKIIGGGAEASWNRMDPGMALKIPAEANLTKAKMDAIQDEVLDYRNNLQKFLRLQGVDLDVLDATVSTFGPNAAAVIKLISATTGIPERILTGSERGELASSQDRSNFADRIAERRTFFATPTVRALVDRLIDFGALPEPSEYEVVWPDIDELSEAEKAEVVGKYATANKAQAQAEGSVLITAGEIRDKILKLAPIEEVQSPGEAAQQKDQAGQGDGSTNNEPPPENLSKAKMFSGSRLLAAKLHMAEKARRGPQKAPPAVSARDAAGEEPEWKRIHRVADSHVGRVMALFVAFWLAISAQVDAKALEEAFAQSDLGAADSIVTRAFSSTQFEWRGKIAAGIKEVFDAAAESSVQAALARGSWLFRKAGGSATARQAASAAGEERFRAAEDLFTASFNAVDPRATIWAATRSGNLITEIGPDTLGAIRTLITSGFAQGIPPAKLAQQIRESIGLRTDQINAASRLEAELASAEPGTLVTRFPPAPTLRTQPGFRVRIPKGGLSEAEIAKRIKRYKQMQLNLRARTIARTETMRAANAGTRESWLQARDRGDLPTDQQREWITANDSAVRDSHADLEGEVVGIDEQFSGGFEPGEEVNCRCTAGLTEKKPEKAK